MTRVLVESGPDTGALWHAGDPGREQRALLAGEAFVDLSHRDTLTVAGKDLRGWLHAITSQDFLGAPEGEPLTALVLDANGRVRFVLEGVIDGQTFLAHTEPGAGEELRAFLASMVFAMRVAIGDGAGLGVVETWADGRPLRRVVPAAEVERLRTERAEAGLWASEALRVAAGVPRLGLDTDERTIPNELGLWGTALDKGCYPGQETVGRVHTLGRPPRRLVRLQLDGSEDRLPGLGSDVVLDGRVVGRVGTGARHVDDGPVALALVKRAVPVEATLLADGIPAAQEVLVDPDVGLHVRPQL